jgi:predicted RNA binding protein with dsRBD fold (UPF0201 family)
VCLKTIKIEIRASLNPTEVKEKVAEAVGNIVDVSKSFVDNSTDFLLNYISEDLMFIKPLYEKLRENRILEAARSKLFNNKTSNMVVFHLNKQAAYVNRLHVCEPTGESPLGPITIIVRSARIEDFIDWLTPKTVNGKPVNQSKELQFVKDL